MDFMSLIKKGVATLNGKFPKRTKFDFRGESQAVLLTLLSRRPEKNSKLLKCYVDSKNSKVLQKYFKFN